MAEIKFKKKVLHYEEFDYLADSSSCNAQPPS